MIRVISVIWKGHISCNMGEVGKKASVGKDAATLTISKIMVSLIGLITSMLLARFRTLEEYGTYSQIIMITDLITTIILLGLPNSINYFLAKTDDAKERQHFLSVYLTLSTILTLIIAVCLNLSVPLIIKYFDNPMIKAFAYVFAIYPWASLMINSLSNTCIVYGKTNRLLVFNIVQAISTLVLLLLSKFVGLSFQWYMILYMSSMLAFAFFSLGWVKRLAGKLRIRLDRRLIKKIFVFSIPMGLASVVGTLNAELDKFIIGNFFSTEEYAIFANAAKELPVTMLATSLTAVLIPCMVRLFKNNKKREAIEVWGYSINISLCFMCLIVGVFFVFAPDIMSLLYSEKYVTAGGIAVFRIYTLILLLRTTYWGVVLNAIGKTKFIFISSILTLFFNLVGNIAGYYVFGFIGPAISSLIVMIVMAFAQLKFTCYLLKIRVKDIFPWKNIGKLLLKMMLFAAFFWIVKYKFVGQSVRGISIIISIGLGAVWTIIYIGVNYKFIIKNWKLLNDQKNE